MPPNEPKVSIVVTTYGDETLYTQQCIERIAGWKRSCHELLVLVHDETALLRLYLEWCKARELVDEIVFAPPRHGHVKGVNLGFACAHGDYLFNINNDVRVGPSVIDDCVERLQTDQTIGLIGWHYDWDPDHEGTFWRSDGLDYTVRTIESGVRRIGHVDPVHMENLQNSPRHNGRVVAAVGDTRILNCNTSFFGVPGEVWRLVGGFDAVRYPDYWSDDFLCYAVLDHGYNIANLPKYLRCAQRPDLFISLSDHKWRGIPEPDRHHDALQFEGRIWEAPAATERLLEEFRKRNINVPLERPTPATLDGGQ